jgi:hypothetical protein
VLYFSLPVMWMPALIWISLPCSDTRYSTDHLWSSVWGTMS